MAKKVLEFTRKVEVGKDRPTHEYSGPRGGGKGTGSGSPPSNPNSVEPMIPVAVLLTALSVLTIIIIVAAASSHH